MLGSRLRAFPRARAMALGEETVGALCEALDDEYHARATYRRVPGTFGAVRPFVKVVEGIDY